MIKKKEDACILLFYYIPFIISLHYTPAYDIFFYPSLATITPIIYSMGLLARIEHGYYPRLRPFTLINSRPITIQHNSRKRYIIPVKSPYPAVRCRRSDTKAMLPSRAPICMGMKNIRLLNKEENAIMRMLSITVTSGIRMRIIT